ncbi:glutaredoxin [Haloarcula sp. JP-L23]|uniref:glutaredoxin family protein n=1 Tax=Haloarcula sp. JP-L23 TaxID=2716717 RepID=UPI00140F0BCF|nr:glutaredoxin [Haloarcula sp. JP-L23]
MSFEPEERSREEVQENVDDTIENNEVALFMKGSEMMPQCGYSRKAIGLIKQYREDVATVNVLTATEAYREALSEYSGRETIPQTFVDGEFVGGSDILEQLDENGDLEATLNA